MDLAGGAAHHGEVLAGEVNQAAVDRCRSPVTTPSAGSSLPAMPK